MDPAFWHARWSERRIGFHEGRPNSFLARHAARLGDHHRVLVPLCGKSEDLAFLASRGHDVVGVELVESAVREFFADHQLTPTVTPHGALVAYAAPSIQIFAGDVFAATRDVVGEVDAIYDRAALIALPPDRRRRYVDHLRTLGARRVLLVTLELPQAEDVGPPFSVPEAEVRALYDGLHVELLDEGPDGRDPQGPRGGASGAADGSAGVIGPRGGASGAADGSAGVIGPRGGASGAADGSAGVIGPRGGASGAADGSAGVIGPRGGASGAADGSAGVIGPRGGASGAADGSAGVIGPRGGASGAADGWPV